MRIAVSLVTVFALIVMVAPALAQTNPSEDCLRVGAYIDKVENLANRAAPAIRASGNARAMNLFESALADLRSANRAYDCDNCRSALNFARQAESRIRLAMRIINVRPQD